MRSGRPAALPRRRQRRSKRGSFENHRRVTEDDCLSFAERGGYGDLLAVEERAVLAFEIGQCGELTADVDRCMRSRDGRIVDLHIGTRIASEDVDAFAER